MHVTKETLLRAVTRRTRTEPSPIFGGDLCVREHSRAEFRALQERAALPDAGENMINTDRWYGGLFANAVVDPKTGDPLLTFEDVLAFPERDDLWAEVRRIAQLSLDLSEVGREAVVKSDLPANHG